MSKNHKIRTKKTLMQGTIEKHNIIFALRFSCDSETGRNLTFMYCDAIKRRCVLLQVLCGCNLGVRR